jgi:two-component system NarL family sensor kinase
MADANATTSTARELARFALSGLAALVLLAAAGAFVLRDRGRSEAVRDARGVAELTGRGIIEPALEPGVLRGDPRAVARPDRIVRSRVLTGRSVRVKIWDAAGRIVYSDEPRLRGSRYRL